MNVRVWAQVLVGAALAASAGPAEAQKVERQGWLGFSYEATAANGDVSVLINGVYPLSPAARAGIREGDAIIRVDGEDNVLQALDALPLEPGDTVRLRLRQGNQRDRELTVVAARRPNTLALFPPDPPPPGARERARDRDRRVYFFNTDSLLLRVDSLMALQGRDFVWPDSLMMRADSLHRGLELMLRDSLGPKLRAFADEFQSWVPEGGARAVITMGRRSVAGAEFEEMNPGLSSYFGTDEGALVLRVAPGTPAARAGLRPGDVVLEVNERAVDSVDDLRNAVTRAQGMRPRAVQLEVLRQGRRQEIDLRWE